VPAIADWTFFIIAFELSLCYNTGHDNEASFDESSEKRQTLKTSI
jgi:hypothetical protein